MACDSSNAVTHNGGSGKKFATVEWTAPNVDSTKTFKFVFTVVQHRQTFWVKSDAKSQLTVEPSSVSPTSGTSKPETLPSPIVNGASPSTSGVLHENYKGCAANKGCFGSESNCIENGSCKLMFSYQYSSATKSFQMLLHGNGIEAKEYVAMGISSDAGMGSDLVFFCSNGGANVNVAWNKGKDNLPGVTGVTVRDATVKTINGVTTCVFTVDESLNAVPPSSSGASSAQKFDLATSKYHILLATGAINGEKLSYHSFKTPSPDPIDLKSSSLIAGSEEGWHIQVIISIIKKPLSNFSMALFFSHIRCIKYM